MSIAEELLTERMNALARELVSLQPGDPRRAEVVEELSQLSQISASAKPNDDCL